MMINKMHIIAGAVQNKIYEMSKRSQIVKDIISKKLEFMSDPRNRYISYNHAMDLQIKYYDGMAEGKAEGKAEGRAEERENLRIDYFNRVLKRFKMKYDEKDTKFLENLSLETYKEIYEMIIDDVSINNIKVYVESVK